MGSSFLSWWFSRYDRTEERISSVAASTIGWPQRSRMSPEREALCARLAAVVSIAALQPSEIAYVDECLPLSRLDQQIAEGSTYLVAWDDDRPVGHAHIAWVRTHLGVPEIQDVFVLSERRRQGIGAQLTDAAEEEARARGWETISLSVSQDGNIAARNLYAKLGYADAGVDPVRVSGVITVRGRPFEVDDTLVYFTKSLCPRQDSTIRGVPPAVFDSGTSVEIYTRRRHPPQPTGPD
jgi:GNAT superfamily N-acetyltransferase